MNKFIKIIFATWIIAVSVFVIGQIAYNHYLTDQMNMIVDAFNR